MRHLDLFSGIGGFALAVEEIWPKSEHIFCDNDSYCQRLLKLRFPNLKIYGDIKEIKTVAYSNQDGLQKPGKKQQTSRHRQLFEDPSERLFGKGHDSDSDSNGRAERKKKVHSAKIGKQAFHDFEGCIDLVTGGFPCQPFSQAGKRRGTDDDRYLWPEMLRVIRLTKPRWVIAENVRGLLTMQNGMVFEQVCLDLEASGYEVQPFIIPAVSVNAPHRRDRIWFVAHAVGDTADRKKKSGKLSEASGKQKQVRAQHGSARQSLRTTFGGRGERFEKNSLVADAFGNAEGTRQSSGHERQGKTQYGRTSSGSDKCVASDTEGKRKGRLSGKERGIEKRTMEQSKSKRSEIRCESERCIGDDSDADSGRLQKPGKKQQANRSRQSHKNIGNTKSDAEHPFRKISQRKNALTGRSSRNASHAKSGKSRKPSEPKRWKGFERRSWERSWLEVATKLCGVDDGLPAELDGFELTKSRHRIERLKALGNAIVPQVAMEIMRAIKKSDENIGNA